MKQKQFSPLSIAEMALSLYAANEGYLDDIPLNKVGAFEAGLHAFFKSQFSDLMKKINETGDYNGEIEAGLKKAVESFKATGTW
mgnify:FL=1